MKISNRQIKDMELCEKSNGAKDCFECSANVCLMKYETDLKLIEELEAKATKWDMMQWALDKEIEFVASYGTHDEFLHINDLDFKYLEQLYKEREQE